MQHKYGEICGRLEALSKEAHAQEDTEVLLGNVSLLFESLDETYKANVSERRQRKAELETLKSLSIES